MENKHNPYQTPTTVELEIDVGDSRQSSRTRRLGAAFIDGLVMLAIVMPIQWKAGVFDGYPTIQSQGYGETLMWTAVGFGILLLLNGYLLATRAQTIGKAALGIKIVTLDGSNAGFGRIVLRRMLPLTLTASIPIIGGFVSLIDSLFIFRKNKRCVHDLIAGTRVVHA
ncbi:MAG: RDD family protein [Planctomycetes bacterium]|nr:RDD family protein [Planctomycetota bacterium]